jgi:thiosulfate dehydrogenase [quinone] large subunit
MPAVSRDLDQALTPQHLFALAGIMALSIRLVQGWVFWAGASRRLFYDLAPVAANGDAVTHAVKMDPNAAGYVANKLAHAMPGSLFPDLIQWVMLQASFLHFMVWFWTLAELVVGVGLLLGLATRLLAFASVGLNVSLMLIFGWMGSTCVDEWTMAACGFAMGATLMLTGGGQWSVDQWLAGRAPAVGERTWFRLLFSGPLSLISARRWGLGLGLLSLLFTVGFYQYLHGAVVSPLHSRVNFHQHNIVLSDARVDSNGDLSVHAYVDAGPDTGKLYLVEAALLQGDTLIQRWGGAALSALPLSAIDNLFTQPWGARIAPTNYGLGAVTGAKAMIRLPGQQPLEQGRYRLRLTDIDGRSWETAVIVALSP